MSDNINPDTPDDSQHKDALGELEDIINGAAASMDKDGDGIISAEELAASDLDAVTDEAGADTFLTAAEAKAAEHLADLQRLQAEYVNYRKRVDRDRAQAGEHATAKVIEALIPALDDIAAARDHGDLAEGPFASIAAKLEENLGRFGWQTFGAAGEAFNPLEHEALMSQPSADVTEPTIMQVAQPGHRVGERVIRPARVIVAQPEGH
jgi:molecular chaperone GrpE